MRYEGCFLAFSDIHGGVRFLGDGGSGRTSGYTYFTTIQRYLASGMRKQRLL